MAFAQFVLAALTLTVPVCRSHPTELVSDQYEVAGSKGAHFEPYLTTSRATDLPPLALDVAPIHTQKAGPSGARKEDETTQLQKTKLNLTKTLTKFEESANMIQRKRRSFYPYTGLSVEGPQFQSLSVWQPSIYPLQRPYYIPVFGVPGRIPLYFPPQPFLVNPGSPVNPATRPPYHGPSYLPPVDTSETTTMNIGNRFGEDDYDDRPVWDNNDLRPQAPTTSRTFVPTRKPPAAGGRTHPPLVHDAKDNTTSTTTPATPVDSNNKASGNQFNPIGGRPASANVPPPNVPSRCVWAIVSCCSTDSNSIRYGCFEQLGCQGPFWDVNPCESDFAKRAIATALEYYNSRSA